jgi:hypothetical protein
MKCWNLVSNAQGWKVLIIDVQVGAMEIYAEVWRHSRKRKDAMKLNLPPKLVENLIWNPVISFCKISIPSYTFNALLCWNWPFYPLIMWLHKQLYYLSKYLYIFNLLSYHSLNIISTSCKCVAHFEVIWCKFWCTSNVDPKQISVKTCHVLTTIQHQFQPLEM